jgi:hypothetical protein
MKWLVISRLRTVSMMIGMVVLLIASACAQTERITSLHTDIVVNPDATLRVTETIVFNVTGEHIKHGISRVYNTVHREPSGRSSKVTFKLTSVTRDGAREPYRLAAESTYTRVYIGDRNATVPPGRHFYVIIYTMDNMLHLGSDHDELFWNVIGNAGSFTVDKATATVHLPKGIPASALKLSGYTGPKGSRARNYRSSIDRAGLVHFTATVPLAPKEGFSISVSFPKGRIKAPRRWRLF